MGGEATDPEVSTRHLGGAQVIETHELTISFGRTLALDAIDVTIRPGVTGLFGQNGSGKSTLLRAFAGLLRPTRGAVSVLGADPVRANEALRRMLGYSGHGSGLYARLSLRENLEFFARMYDVHERTTVDRTIDRLGLNEHVDKPVADLSAGNKRRAAVARAMLHAPHVLLLDEPYANVDDEAADLISDAIQEWAVDRDRIAVIATHGAKRVKAFASAGIILRQGHVVKQGTYAPVGASG